jgi:peptidoglycan-associated lipoprotein
MGCFSRRAEASAGIHRPQSALRKAGFGADFSGTNLFLLRESKPHSQEAVSMTLESYRRCVNAAMILAAMVVLAGLSGCKKNSAGADALEGPYVEDATGTDTLADAAVSDAAPTDSVPADPSQYAVHSTDPSRRGQTPGHEGIDPSKATRAEGYPVAELEMILFDFDKADLREDAKKILDRNAQWIAAHPGVKVKIEGHCDELGTPEYNFSLGLTRAEAVRNYLVGMGIDPARLETISYGKERPLVSPEDTPEARAKNRRAQFLAF